MAYGLADVMNLLRLIEKSAAEAGVGEDVTAASFALLNEMRRFATALRCRHKMLSEYFGQKYERAGCGACDVCLGELEGVEDGTVTAQKILSCVARTGERFGANHIADVLLGADNARVRQWRHEQLSTYGLLRDTARKSLLSMLYQLVDQGLLERTGGDRPILQLNPASWEVLRGRQPVRLIESRERVATPAFDEDSWEGVDRGLFESLRECRRRLASERAVPPYLIFGDATLRELARKRPASSGTFAAIRGVGERKLADLGPIFLAHLRDYCAANDLALEPARAQAGAPKMDGRSATSAPPKPAPKQRLSARD